jgi:hypothetical protein
LRQKRDEIKLDVIGTCEMLIQLLKKVEKWRLPVQENLGGRFPSKRAIACA